MLRLLEEKDLKECLSLLSELTVVGYDFDILDVFNKIKNNKDYYIFVYEMEEKVVGMATIFIEQKFIRNGGTVGHIEDVVVSAKYREKGIGKKLLLKCIDIAKERKCYKVILDCDLNYLPFYNKIGFIKYGESMKIVL